MKPWSDAGLALLLALANVAAWGVVVMLLEP